MPGTEKDRIRRLKGLGGVNNSGARITYHGILKIRYLECRNEKL